MAAVPEEVSQLFDLVDAAPRMPEPFTRALIECILHLDPSCSRAQQLLDVIDGYEPIDATATLEAIEKAERYAAEGQASGARAMMLWIRRHHGNHPLARRWLEGAHLLLEG